MLGIEKGGDVIPKVVKVDLSQRKHGTHSWHMPSLCPICNTPVVHHLEEVAVRCPNFLCLGQKVRRIIYFASKPAMDIDHMGEKVVEQLVEKKLIDSIADIYSLTENDLMQLEGFKEKSIQNLLASIERSKKCPLSRFIMGLGIPYVGTETAEELAFIARDIPALMNMKEDELKSVKGIGEKTATAIYSFFQDPIHRREIELLLERGVEPREMKPKMEGHLFSGKTFVLTGTLSRYSREEASILIKERGGKISGTVSKNTDYVLVGQDPGSKYTKAKELKIKILSEEEFEEKLTI